MVSGSITIHGLSKNKVDQCWVCRLRVNANSVLCVTCGKLIHDRSAGVKKITPKFYINFACRKCEENIAGVVEQAR